MHTVSKKKARRPKTPPPAPPAPSFTPAQLLRVFLQLLPRQTLRNLPALENHSFYDRLFTPLTTLWYLIFQRLNFDHSLDAALTDALGGGADRLNRKLSRELRSESTAAYSDARQRLPWKFLLEALAVQARHLADLSPATRWQGRIVALLDGSTVRLRPCGNIPKEFAPHRNQAGRPYWCLMRVTACFCALSGAVLDCALGAVGISEQAMAGQLILRSLASCLFIGDRNFGVFRVAQAARHAQRDVLLRMTACRARKLLGRDLAAGDHPVRWKHTRRGQLEPGCSAKPIPGRLLVVWLRPRGGRRGQWLCLFTNLAATPEFSCAALVRLYARRWHAELNLRYLKTQMCLAQLSAKSADMARKEWLSGLLGYNLIRGAQLCAALLEDLPPLSLSFSGVRRRLEDWLSQWAKEPRLDLEEWSKALKRMGRCRLPKRRKRRPSEPRAQRHLRQPYPPLHGSRSAARKRLGKYASKS